MSGEPCSPTASRMKPICSGSAVAFELGDWAVAGKSFGSASQHHTQAKAAVPTVPAHKHSTVKL